MNILLKTITATAFVLAITAPAMAFTTVVLPNIVEHVRTEAGPDTEIRINVDGNSLVLTGYIEDYSKMLELEQLARERGAINVVVYVIRSE